VLQLPVHNLDKPIPLRGFDGQPSEAIRKVLEADLGLDKHVQTRRYLLVAELGSHDLILGRKWLVAHDVLPDCRRNQLHWPEDHKIDQQDADRRDQLFEREQQRSTPTKVLKRTNKERPKRKSASPQLGKDFYTRKAEY
jgi:hypothetical protein